MLVAFQELFKFGEWHSNVNIVYNVIPNDYTSTVEAFSMKVTVPYGNM